MGHTLNSLSEREANKRVIFHHRFVVECCEQFHVHYRNLRILLSERDFVSMANGMKDALERWDRRGKPEPKEGTHIELCRKEVALHPVDDGKIKVNLNENLYEKNDGKIFADGAGLEDKQYIHLKIRDLRLEMTLEEFEELHKTVVEARVALSVIHYP